MIKSFAFKNYKSFKEGKIELQPITILLGANSVGKSSILQLLSMIKQTVNIDKQYKSALKLNGEYVSLGENKNIFHNQKTAMPVELTFEISNFSINIIKKYFEDTLDEILISFERIYSFLISDIGRIRKPFRRDRNKNYDRTIEKIQSLKIKINNKLKAFSDQEHIEDFFEKIIGHPRHRRSVSLFYNKKENKINLDLKHYKKAYNLIKKLSIKLEGTVFLSYQITFEKDDLKICRIEVRTKNNDIILGYSQNIDRIRHNLYSDILDNNDLKIYKSKFGKNISIEKLNIFSKNYTKNPLRFKYQAKTFQENIFLEIVYSIFKKTISSVLENFSPDNINYVSPLRAFPKRYYFLDESNISSSLNTIDGNQLTEILKEDKKIKKLVNDWLMNFQLKVDVNNLADVIHNIKINQHGLNLDITDVGFGLSQVLPVIVQGFLSRELSLTIIEQPEIHLHPKMQADLADLFIDIVVDKEDRRSIKKNLLIETHSEYLLKRLRRRIAEGAIPAECVAIYFVHPKDSKTKSGKIEKIEISNTGNFEWPKDFYSTDLADTIEFLKYQK